MDFKKSVARVVGEKDTLEQIHKEVKYRNKTVKLPVRRGKIYWKYLMKRLPSLEGSDKVSSAYHPIVLTIWGDSIKDSAKFWRFLILLPLVRKHPNQ